MPERNHLGADGLFAIRGVGGGERKPVEIFQLPGDAAALQQNRLPGHLGGVRGEYRGDRHLAQSGKSLRGGHSGGFQTLERAAKRTRGRNMLAVQRAGATAAFAMVGLGKIGKFKVNCESLRDLMGLREVHLRDHLLDPGHRIARYPIVRHQIIRHQIIRGGGGRAPSSLFAMFDQQLPQLLDCIKQLAAALLDQHLPEQRAERADVPPQGIVFRGVLRPCRELGEPGVLVFGLPQQFGLAHEGGQKGIANRINERERIVGGSDVCGRRQ